MPFTTPHPVTAPPDLTWLESVYRRFHRPELIDPDPLIFPRRYVELADREVAAVIASCLAYGRVGLILRAVESVLAPMGDSPAAFVDEVKPAQLRKLYRGFRYRFAGEEHLCHLLTGIGRLRREYGSVGAALGSCVGRGDQTVVPGLSGFVAAFRRACGGDVGHLLADPGTGSACKRLNLLLRWMVREDAIDPGGWESYLSPSMLVVPLDTHMHRVARQRGWTSRSAADLKAALEVTAALRRYDEADPVRFDFALTRPGIRGDRD